MSAAFIEARSRVLGANVARFVLSRAATKAASGGSLVLNRAQDCVVRNAFHYGRSLAIKGRCQTGDMVIRDLPWASARFMLVLTFFPELTQIHIPLTYRD
ncbi:MAG: hypothetical protein AAF483_30790 [Planctomycetota bacterium]